MPQAFPLANRGTEVRKFHLKSFLQKQQAAGFRFADVARDFQLLLHAAGLLPDGMLAALCEALAAKDTPSKAVKELSTKAIEEAQRALGSAAGMAP